jgi:tetratricopeptide (TPR) repeat protein
VPDRGDPHQGSPRGLHQVTEAERHYRRGVELEDAGRIAEARESYGEALACDPRHARAHNNLGVLLQAQGDLQGALRSYRQAVDADAGLLHAVRNLAAALLEASDAEAAEKLVADALPRHSGDAALLFIHGDALNSLGRVAQAEAAYRAAIQADRRFTDAYLKLALLRRTADPQEAEALLRIAAEADPANPAPCVNLGSLYEESGQLERALECYEAALARDPESARAHFNRALLLLLKGDYARGLEEYEWRWRLPEFRERRYDSKGTRLPKWRGQHGQSVLVYGEQGIGDEILFASCLPDLAACSARVVLNCDPRLEDLFRRSFPSVRVHGTRFRDHPEWIDDDQLDASVAIGDLPRFFRKAPEQCPGTPYLRARATTHASTPRRASAPRIGLAWTGGTDGTGSARRSLALATLLPLLESVPATWVSLEYIDRRDQLQALKAGHGIDILAPEEARSQNYDDAAALVAGLDLVIAATTAVVHLAGALGKECWVLVPTNPRWWYGVDADTTSWYGSLRLFRQRGSWDGAIREAARLLKVRHG